MTDLSLARFVAQGLDADRRRARWLDRFLRRMTRRPPDAVIGGRARPYMLRWYVIPRNRLFNVYLHLFLRDDDDRALHDHPWANLSIPLEGEYLEHTIRAGGIHVRTLRRPGRVKLRSARAAHRVELIPNDGGQASPCWTLFLTGPTVREWGFHCPTRWIHWREFTDPKDSGAIGRGCGEP